MSRKFNEATQSYEVEEQSTEDQVEEDLTNEEEKIKEYFRSLIPHPEADPEDEYPITMALVFSEGRTFLGGVSGIQTENDLLITMHSPVVVQEGLVRDPQTGGIHPQISFMPLSFTIVFADKVLIKASMFYQLKSKHEADRNTVTQYADKLRELQAQSVGIYPPSGQDIANIRQVTP